MAQSDTIAIVFDEAELKSIQDAIGVLNTILLPKLKSLSAQDRHELPKMGDKSVAFVQKAFEYGKRHPTLRPAFLDMDAFSIDVASIEVLRDLIQALDPVIDALGDSLLLAGSEAYQAALVFYKNVKNAIKLRIAAAQGVYDDLASRFPGGPASAKSAVAKP